MEKPEQPEQPYSLAPYIDHRPDGGKKALVECWQRAGSGDWLSRVVGIPSKIFYIYQEWILIMGNPGGNGSPNPGGVGALLYRPSHTENRTPNPAVLVPCFTR